MENLLGLIILAIAYYLLDTYVIPEGPFKFVIRALVVLALVYWLLTEGRAAIHSMVGLSFGRN